MFDRRAHLLALLACGWLCFELVNIAWPRHPALPWYENYAVPVGASALTLLGIVYVAWRRPHRRHDAVPAGDSAEGSPDAATSTA
jgi:TRAP-type C4-dicarboxylate transport system permease small subunit